MMIDFWSAQIDQIYVDDNDEIDLIPTGWQSDSTPWDN